ncbi:protein sprouty homolog 2 [Athalia rosae]|uniref:protein sprouty homolog 2 n=1 Tax=Athalia rosae TaxID=37344 RepID=UPI0020332134|nr:protein sprouty homolog 2 [Athalia rosae]
MSRPPSSSSSSSSGSFSTQSPTPVVNTRTAQSTQTSSLPSTLARVHGHDHNRPLPPPRLQPETTTGTTVLPPITAPLTPLSSSSLVSTTGVVRTSSRAPAPAPVPVHDVVRITTGGNVEQEPHHLQSQQIASSRNTTAVLSEVTLTVPRPDGERAVNEYVETPFRPNLVTNTKCPKSDRTKRHHHHLNHHHHHHHHHHHLHHQSHTGRNTITNPSPASSAPTKTLAVTKQPVSFTKEPTNSIGSPGSIAQQIQQQQQQQQQQQRSSLFPGVGIGGGGGGVGGGGGNVGGVIIPLDEGLSIMCEYCGRCRCESCREPPPLPSRWLCDNACFCSAETALDYASCLCCVKGLFYHCADGGSGVDTEGEGAGSCADEPCSCTGSRRLARWTCLGALALALPCLLCYWPLKGCVALCEACYARHASHGCRCDPSTAGRHLTTSTLRDSRDPEKRLLDPVTPEL